ncbi:MAG: hypothetical protein GF331_12775 [Chitinivibrionales bacterium]|nr:hypothetical protein [Chitinivibrionales bacterium]
MRTFSKVSISRARHWLPACVTALAVSLVMTCTISEDNGDLADPGEYNPVSPGGGGTPPVITDENPVFVIQPISSCTPGDTITVTFTLYDQGDDSSFDYIDYVDVIVSLSPQSGWVSDDTVRTDRNGRGAFRYSDTATGERTVVLSYGGVSSTPARFSVTREPPPEERLMAILPESPTLKADGKTSTSIFVTVMNEDHHPMVGKQVRFTATAGVIAGVDRPTPEESGIAITNEDGVATATLTSANINDTAYIQAFLVSDMSMNAETHVAFNGVHIVLDIDTTNLRQDQEAIVTAHLYNASDIAIAQVPMYFILGKGGTSNLRILDKDSLTGFDGMAQAMVKGVSTGSDSLIVGAAGARAVVTLNVTSLNLDVELAQKEMVADDTVSTTLDVRFTDLNGSPLSNKLIRVVRHYPDADGAEVSDTLTGYTGTDGKAQFRIEGLPYDGTMRLGVTAYNTLQDLATREATLRFTTTRHLTIKAVPTIVQADGSSYSTITVQVKNDENNPIVGETVLFSTTGGLIEGKKITDSSGQAIAKLRSDRRNVDAMVKARLQDDATKTDSVKVIFAGVTVTSNATPRSIRSSWADTSHVSIRVTDAMGTAIPGEPVNFAPQDDSTRVVYADETTDNRGEARCKVVGGGEGSDTIVIVSAGASVKQAIFYASNIVVVDSVVGSLIADGMSTTRVVVRYLDGDSVTPIGGAPVNVSVTLGSMDSAAFARELTTGADGRASFNMINPSFANTATISMEASTSEEVTSGEHKVYFRANRIDRIELTVSPSVISTNGDKGTITAVAYDAQNNRVADAPIAFNLLEGPGGGEYIDPPTAVTGFDGVAKSSIVGGALPSMFREVEIVAGDFVDGSDLKVIKSDTAKLTIAGPPKYITVGTNILEGINPSDGTFILPCAAIVTDINGNPVADGTEVTFSCKISGYVVWHLTVDWLFSNTTGDYYWWIEPIIDSSWTVLPFEDFNDNYQLDQGEDRNFDERLNRGEDWNGDGMYHPGPGFEDINANGRRDRWPEPYRFYDRWTTEEIMDTVADTVTGYRNVLKPDTAYADYNHNGILDTIEPLLNEHLDSTMTWQEYKTLEAAAPGGQFDRDHDGNGVADPATAVSITRTVQTVGGKATNEIIYAQSDAWKIEVKLSAESQGVVTKSPEVLILPVIE